MPNPSIMRREPLGLALLWIVIIILSCVVLLQFTRTVISMMLLHLLPHTDTLSPPVWDPLEILVDDNSGKPISVLRLPLRFPDAMRSCWRRIWLCWGYQEQLYWCCFVFISIREIHNVFFWWWIRITKAHDFDVFITTRFRIQRCGGAPVSEHPSFNLWSQYFCHWLIWKVSSKFPFEHAAKRKGRVDGIFLQMWMMIHSPMTFLRHQQIAPIIIVFLAGGRLSLRPRGRKGYTPDVIVKFWINLLGMVIVYVWLCGPGEFYRSSMLDTRFSC